LIGITELYLELGDLAAFYTDGISEAINPAGQQYGLERLAAVLRENRSQKAGEIRQAAIADLMQYIGTQKVFDDITLVVMKQT
jgi:serine phosphatase RsbU (regulator of sigma subunit)